MLLATCFSGNACVLSTFNHREKTHQKKNAPKAMPASVFFHVLPVTLWVATAPPQKQGGPENPKAKRHRANHFFLHVGNSTVSSSLRRNLDVFPVAVDQSLHWSSCASVDRLIPSKHPLVDHFMHMANGAMPTSKATENDWCVSAI